MREDMKKRGRPKKDNTRDHQVKVRLSGDELGMILDRVNRTGDSYSGVMRKALRFYYRMAKNGD